MVVLGFEFGEPGSRTQILNHYPVCFFNHGKGKERAEVRNIRKQWTHIENSNFMDELRIQLGNVEDILA